MVGPPIEAKRQAEIRDVANNYEAQASRHSLDAVAVELHHFAFRSARTVRFGQTVASILGGALISCDGQKNSAGPSVPFLMLPASE